MMVQNTYQSCQCDSVACLFFFFLIHCFSACIPAFVTKLGRFGCVAAAEGNLTLGVWTWFCLSAWPPWSRRTVPARGVWPCAGRWALLASLGAVFPSGQAKIGSPFSQVCCHHYPQWIYFSVVSIWKNISNFCVTIGDQYFCLASCAILASQQNTCSTSRDSLLPPHPPNTSSPSHLQPLQWN